MAKNKTKSKATTKAAAAEVAEDDEDLDIEETTDSDELEELDEDEVAEAAPKKAKKGASKAADEVTFGASDLAALITERGDKEISARDLRTLLRKMARDGRITREITPGNKARYNWSGPDDPEVKMIVKAALKGEIEAGKQEALAKLKEQKATKQAEKDAAAKKGETKKKAKAAAPVEDDDDEELED